MSRLTCLQNYYIPPIIFAVQQNLVEDTELRICIDGKQRCTSILNFMDGKIPFISPSTKQKFWLSKFGNQKSGTQLPETLKRRFEQITIQVVEYDGIKDEQQRDIFRELTIIPIKLHRRKFRAFHRLLLCCGYAGYC